MTLNVAWQATVQDDTGNLVPLPVVTVRNASDNTLATLYDEDGNELVGGNPITGDANGFVQFYAPPGEYTIEGAKDGSVTELWAWQPSHAPIKVDKVWSVADYGIQGALDYTRLGPTAQGITHAVHFPAGSEWDENVVLTNGDWSNTVITSDDAIVPVAAGFTGDAINLNNARGLTWDILLDMQDTGRYGIYGNASHWHVKARKGVINAQIYGGFAYNGSSITSDFIVVDSETRDGPVFRGARQRGLDVTYNSTASVVGADLRDCGTVLTIDNGHAGLFASRGSTVHADFAKYSGSVRGIRCARSTVCTRDSYFAADDTYGACEQAMWQFEEGWITAAGAVLSGCGSATWPILQVGDGSGTDQGGGIINAQGAIISKPQGLVARVYGGGGTINLSDALAKTPIEAITLTGTDPVEVTITAHGYSTGDSAGFANVGGTVELNGNTYTITVTDADNFTLDGTDSSAFTAYTSGGTVNVGYINGAEGGIATVTSGTIILNGVRAKAAASSVATEALFAAAAGRIEASGFWFDGAGVVDYSSTTDKDGYVSIPNGNFTNVAVRHLRNQNRGGTHYTSDATFDNGESYQPVFTRDLNSYDERSDFEAVKEQYAFAADGTIVWAKGLGYERSAAATDIADLQGWLPVGVAEPGHFATNTTPGATDMSDALGELIDFCRTRGRRGRAVGTFYCASTTITDDTHGLIDWSDAVLTSTAGGQAAAVFEVMPASGDIDTNNATLLSAGNTALPFVKGQSVISGLSGYAGSAIKLVSTDAHARRSTGADYRYEVYFRVLDGEGRIDPPIPFDVPNTVTWTSCREETVRDRVTVNLPTVQITSGTTARTTGLIRCERSNTVLSGGRTINDTTATMAVLGAVDECVGVTWENGAMTGAKDDGTQYGYNVTGAGHTFLNCSQADCRRGLDGNYAHHVRVIGGNYPDGLGGHWVFGLSVSGGAIIGSDKAGTTPAFDDQGCVKVAGGDTTVHGCTIHRDALSPVLFVRDDLFEHRGVLSMTECKIYADLGGDSTSDPLQIVRLGATSFDPQRTVYSPDKVVLKGNNIRVTNGGSWTGNLQFMALGGWGSISGQDIEVDCHVDIDGNTVVWDQGALTPTFGYNRTSNWTGAGFRFNINHVDGLSFTGTSSVSDTTARTDLDLVTGGAATVTLGGGGVRKAYIRAESITMTESGTLQGDEEWWHSLGGGWQRRTGSIADDGVFSFYNGAGNYGQYRVIQINGGAAAVHADWITDHAGTDLPTLINSGNATVGLYSTALNGTTGTDVQLNLGEASGVNYIENRTGGALSFLLQKVAET